MNIVRINGVDFGAHASLIACIELAMDASVTRNDEVEVIYGGVKVAGFARGRRVFPLCADIEIERLADLELRMIGEALTQTNGDKTKAARLLGIGKTTLFRKAKAAGI